MSLIKIANAYALSEERRNFIKQHNLGDEDSFLSDPTARKIVEERRRNVERQTNAYFKDQAKAGGGISPELSELRKKYISDVNAGVPLAIKNQSIDRIKKQIDTDPEQFKHFQGLSSQSDKALGKSHGKELGATLGAIGGAGLGLLAGKRLPRRNTGLLQRGGGALLGGVAGGATLGSIGSARDEKRTGFNHEDILKPYEIADRMQNQRKFK